MSDALLASYEEVPYESNPLRDGRPEVLEIAGRVRGIEVAPSGGCRVLELGCATGGNIIPLALTHPGSTFVGIDLSPRQIEMGREVAEGLGISNLRLEAVSILDITREFGEFDYILCHGVYSWVPEVVREKILGICRENLVANGIAYISYNTYPGWHLRGMCREMMGYHARRETRPRERIGRARGFLERLSKGVVSPGSPYAEAIAQEAKLLEKVSDTYLFHEHLEEFNRPVYFHQFAEQCGKYGLNFVGETRLSNIAAAGHSAEIRAALAEMAGDEIEREQYLDFLVNRTFRNSLVTKAKVGETLNLRVMGDLFIESNILPMEAGAKVGKTRDSGERTIGGVMARAIGVLNEVWPRAMSFGELWRRVPEQSLPRELFDGYMRSVVELYVQRPNVVSAVGERPRAFQLARYLAERGQMRVVSARHRTVGVGDFERLVLATLDGRRTHELITAAVTERIGAGEFALTFQGQAVTDPGMIREGVVALLPGALAELAGAGLLVDSVPTAT